MKIAFVVSFFDFRNDVRRVIAEVVRQHQVVVFGNEIQTVSIQRHLPEGVELRLIQERKQTVWNLLWERTYLFFKQLPKSRNNYFLMQLFHASNAPNVSQKQKALRILNWAKKLPKVISYDAYLSYLDYSSSTLIDDIDHFIFYTSIADDYLLSRLIKNNHPVSVYVYSWDHACKNPKFSKRTQYLCWSEGIRNDIHQLHQIALSDIRVVGASQFGYIHEFHSKKQSLKRTFSFEYVYFGCAVGIPELARDEVNLIRQIQAMITEHLPGLTLVVRPYPVMKDWALYDQLRHLPNLILDEGFRNTDLSISEDALFEKFEKIHFAKAFLHLGTTMGLEACFTDTPSFILDMGYQSIEGLSLYNFIHQYQNDKYLIEPPGSNTVRSMDQLIKILSQEDLEAYLRGNREVADRFQPVHSFPTLAHNMIDYAQNDKG